MTDLDQKQLGRTLWNIADQLRGAMNADDFRDYMLSFRNSLLAASSDATVMEFSPAYTWPSRDALFQSVRCLPLRRFLVTTAPREADVAEGMSCEASRNRSGRKNDSSQLIALAICSLSIW